MQLDLATEIAGAAGSALADHGPATARLHGGGESAARAPQTERAHTRSPLNVQGLRASERARLAPSGSSPLSALPSSGSSPSPLAPPYPFSVSDAVNAS